MDVGDIVSMIISQMMSGQVVDRSDINLSPITRSVGRPHKEQETKDVKDDPSARYHKLAPGQIDDINNSDIMFLSIIKRRLCAGFFHRDHEGKITDSNLPASIIDICSDIESKKLPPTIKEIIENKFVSDPTGGFTSDEIKDKVIASRDSVTFGKNKKNKPVD